MKAPFEAAETVSRGGLALPFASLCWPVPESALPPPCRECDLWPGRGTTAASTQVNLLSRHPGTKGLSRTCSTNTVSILSDIDLKNRRGGPPSAFVGVRGPGVVRRK